MTRFGGPARSKSKEGRVLGTLCSLAVAGVAGSAGCHREIVAPGQDAVALSTVNVSNECTRVQFRISGNNTVTGTLPAVSCGNSPFKIVSGGPMEWKKNPNRRLKVQVRVVNQDSVSNPPYFVPRLVLAPSGKTVLDPVGTSSATMVPVNADSTRPDGTVVWLLQFPDSILVAPPGAFPPGVPTNARTLEFQINSPTVEGRFDLSVVGERFEEAGDTIRPPIPDTTAWPAIPLLIASPRDTSHRYYRDVFDVSFDDSTSGAGIQQFLFEFSATIIGGSFRTSEHPFYKLQIPDPGNSWTSIDTVRAAMNAWPGVRIAGPASYAYNIRPRGRYPIDNLLTTFRSAWHNPANGILWPWQAIRAPLAWGCEAGRAGANGVHVAVVDQFFQTAVPADLSSPLSSGGGIILPNSNEVVVDAQGMFAYANAQHHGFGVGGIVAATGDNGQGIAGMVWKSNLTLYALSRFNARPNDGLDLLDRHLGDAAQKDIRLINMSFGLGDPDDSVHVDQARVALKKYLDGSDARLLVIATGNDTLNGTRAQVATAVDPKLSATDRVAAELIADPEYRGENTVRYRSRSQRRQMGRLSRRSQCLDRRRPSRGPR